MIFVNRFLHIFVTIQSKQIIKLKIMKILFVQPHMSPKTIGGDDISIFEPLALEYLAAGVMPDHNVKILDMRLEKNFEQVLTEFKPDIVGITAYTAHVNVVKNLFEQVKKYNSGVLTVIGGHHATVAPEDFISPYIDIIVMGEGVLPFREIVQRHAAGKSFEGIPGTAIAYNNGLVKVINDKVIDLDSLPFPDRQLTSKYRDKYYAEWMKPLASIRTSKGCPYRCHFCAEWKVAGGRYLKRKPEQIVEELAQIKEPNVFFADDESLIDAERMTELTKLIKDAGIKKRYYLYGRSDTIIRYPELLEAWRDIGLKRIFVGFEFFRDEDLRYIKKSSSSEDNEKAMRILRKLGIEVNASFIVRQEFSKADFEEYRRYCRRLKTSNATFAVLTPLPGTDLYEEVKDKLILNDPDYFDFIHTLLPTSLPLKEFYSEYRKLFMKASSFRRQLWTLRKYPVAEIPPLLAMARRFYDRLRIIHKDYAA